MVEYFHRGIMHSEADFTADLTLLEYLRSQRKLTGTKEGCASGDCGACTIVLASLDQQGEISYQTVNSCICPASELQGTELITVEDLQGEKGKLHPVQQSFVDSHASQCGFCTPGFVMSTFALRKHNPNPSHAEVDEALSGNLCRCTGYKPIVEAAMSSEAGLADQFDRDKTLRKENLAKLKQGYPPLSRDSRGLALPETLSDLAVQISHWPDAEFIAGGTDLGLEITQNLASKPRLIGLSRIKALKEISIDGDRVVMGSGVSYTAMLEFAREQGWDAFEALLLRIAAEQVRNRGTLGGNIANASPIGDLPPVLLALSAQLNLWSPSNKRRLPISDFFLDYRKTALARAELIQSVAFQMPTNQFFVEKISKRRDDDISIVCIAGLVEVEDKQILSLKLGFGGMAAIPMRALHTETWLKGKRATDLNHQSLVDVLIQDFNPMTDQRGSAQYRINVTASVLMHQLTERLAGVQG